MSIPVPLMCSVGNGNGVLCRGEAEAACTSFYAVAGAKAHECEADGLVTGMDGLPQSLAVDGCMSGSEGVEDPLLDGRVGGFVGCVCDA